MNSKALKYLFGRCNKLKNPLGKRISTFRFPDIDDRDKDIVINYPSDDGIILYLIKRIEKLESKIK